VRLSRRWGKSFFITRLLCETAINGYPAGYFAPTYKLLREVFEECRRRLLPIIASANLSDKVIRLVTGGHIDFWTLEDPDAGRSRKYKLVAIDEAGMARNLGDVYNNAIRATLTDYQGSLWLAGTPKGKGFFYTAWAKGQDPDATKWASWQMPTITNTTVPGMALEMEEARREMPERAFRQEHLAEFLEDAGGVFLGVDEIIQPVRSTASAASIGIDIAKVEDFTVLCALSANGDQVDMERFNRMDWDRQQAKMVAFIQRHPGASVYMDSTGVGSPIYEAVRKALPNRQIHAYHLTAQSKSDLITNLAMQVEQKKISIFDDPILVSEMKAYEYTFNPRTRNVSMNAPEGMHDDTVIALGLAAWPLRTGNFGAAFDTDDFNTFWNS